MAPLKARISASAEQREMWHTLLLLFSREQRTLFLDLIQVTVDEVSKLLKTPKVNKATGPEKLPNVVFMILACVVGCTPLNENVLTSLLLIKRMIKTKWTTIVLFPCYQRYLRSKSTALPHVSFHSSGTVYSLYNMVSCLENIVRLNSFK